MLAFVTVDDPTTATTTTKKRSKNALFYLNYTTFEKLKFTL